MAIFDFYLNGTQVSEPVGWDQIKFNVIRTEQHGIDQPFTTEVTFTGDLDKQPDLANAAAIIRLEFENSFINGSVDIEIVSDIKVDGEIWSFVGKIDLSTYQEVNMNNGCSDGVTVSIIQDDFREQFKSRSDVEIDLLSTVDLNGNYIPELTLETIRTHCQELFLTGSAKNLDTQTSAFLYIQSTGWTLDDFAILLPLYFNNSDFKANFGTTFNPLQTYYTTTSPSFVNNSEFIRTVNFNISASGIFTCGLGFFSGQSANITFSIQVKTALGVETQRLYLYDSPINYFDDDNDTNWSFSVDQQLILNPDDRVFIFMQWGFLGSLIPGTTPSPDTSHSITYQCNAACMNVTEINSAAFATDTDGLFVIDVLKRIGLILTGNPDSIRSDTFDIDGCNWSNFITTGLYLRNAQTVQQLINGCGEIVEGSNQFAIKTSWKKLFEGLDRIFCLGWEFEPDGYNGYIIRVEPVEYFYQNTIQAEFTEVPDIKRFAMSDKLYNAFTLGYSDKWKNIQLQGINAIHTERNYFIPNKALQNNTSAKLDLRSDIIAEGYCIEVYRRLQFFVDTSGSSDRPNDYDLFLIWTNPEEVTIADIEDSGYQFPGETGSKTFAAGTISYSSSLIGTNNSPVDRIYNVLHTPARIAARWWKWLGQYAYGLPTIDQALKFQSGQYFTGFQMAVPDPCEEITSGYLGENFDIDIDSTGTNFPGVLVKPIGYEFEVPQELCDFLTMANEGKRIVKVSSGNSIFAGYIVRAENEPSGNSGGLSKFTLIGTEVPATTGRSYSSGYSSGYS